jgi:PAT family beta-lactamase induction signal transducer AmpG
MQKMSRSFCLEIGFSKLEIANIVQIFGSISIIAGGFVGGYAVKKLGILRAMQYASFAHMLSLFSYIILCKVGRDTNALCLVIFLNEATAGAVSSSFLAFLYDLCKNGSQYAVVWAIHEIGGIIFRSMSGILTDTMGWELFFVTVPVFSIPGLIILDKMIKDESAITACGSSNIRHLEVNKHKQIGNFKS